MLIVFANKQVRWLPPLGPNPKPDPIPNPDPNPNPNPNPEANPKQEAENERMHLIVCMSFFEAGPVTRAAVPLAQLANPNPNPIPIT